MRRFLPVATSVLLLGAAGCFHHDKESDFHRQPAAKAESAFANFVKVLTREKHLHIGYIETEQIRPRNGRDLVEQHYVYNTRFQRMGFVADKGQTYRYVRDTDTEYVGNHPVAVGASVILGYVGEVETEKPR
ncbi:MAG: hypothetical protein HYZ53_18665 [Planctomycetes bacterium]|nr:hypothetical protein [Planctomycetota bacterium]